jgi:hypothetical protein
VSRRFLVATGTHEWNGKWESQVEMGWTEAKGGVSKFGVYEIQTGNGPGFKGGQSETIQHHSQPYLYVEATCLCSPVAGSFTNMWSLS